MTKIGIEIHVQLNTETKLFCSCSSKVSDKPNSNCCEICLGMPGSKPVLNKEALNQAIKVALALNCKVAEETYFSRKSYFYPDLPKNFQISQFELPIASEGNLEGIRIRRIQLEEDPGRLLHKGNIVLVDYNRSSIPLIEIVTEPDFKSIEDVRSFIKKLTTILEYLDVYTKKSEASMRTDANISTDKSQRVEIKNITGAKEVERALNYELELQNKEPAKVQQTKSWDSDKGITFVTRTKETEEDYGFIIEPDLTKIEITKEYLSSIKLPELPEEKAKRLQKELNLVKEDAEVITQEPILTDLFEKVSKEIPPKIAARWIIREVVRVLNYNKKTPKDLKINETHMIELLRLVQQNQITETNAKEILEKLIEKPFSIKDYIKKHKIKTISAKSELEKYCREAIKENPKAVEDYKAGKQEALNFITGQVMKKTKGQATPKEVNEIIKRLI